MSEPLPPNCPLEIGPAITAPSLIEAVTVSTVTGRVNLHLDDGLPVVYTTKTDNPAIQALIAQVAIEAYVAGERVTVTYDGGDNPGGGSTEYCARWMVRLTLEGKRGSLIPWNTPREGE